MPSTGFHAGHPLIFAGACRQLFQGQQRNEMLSLLRSAQTGEAGRSILIAGVMCAMPGIAAPVAGRMVDGVLDRLLLPSSGEPIIAHVFQTAATVHRAARKAMRKRMRSYS